jgi:hypothetical protein
MKDFIMKGHMLTEIDLSYCSFETLVKLYPEYKKLWIKKSALPNSPEGSTIEEYEFKDFTAQIFRWKNGIQASDGRTIYTQILEIRAKTGSVYQNKISLGMKRPELEKRLGKISVTDFQSIYEMNYFFTLILTFDKSDTLTGITWKRNMEE